MTAVSDEKVIEEMINWRRHLHQNPELSFQEFNTSNFVYDQLKALPNLIVTRPTKTSVLAILKGSASSKGPKIIAFRADMDALPITEEANIPYKSTNPGVMHACGHDAHTTILLGAAKVLSRKVDEINGEIRFIFQHAEESPPGGAKELVEKGVLEDVDYAFALHVSPYAEVGTIFKREGVLCASNDDFEITIIGHGGHAATPHLTVDPIIIGAEILTNIQQIVSRKLPVHQSPVISVTKINGGTALNVIPEKVTLAGTIRSVDPEIRKQAKAYVKQVVEGITKTHGASYEEMWHEGYASVINDVEAVSITSEVSERVFGKENIIPALNPLLGGEDFSAMSRIVPSSMQFIGAHNKEFGKTYPLHHPKFKIDESVLKYGLDYFYGIAMKICGNN